MEPEFNIEEQIRELMANPTVRSVGKGVGIGALGVGGLAGSAALVEHLLGKLKPEKRINPREIVIDVPEQEKQAYDFMKNPLVYNTALGGATVAGGYGAYKLIRKLLNAARERELDKKISYLEGEASRPYLPQDKTAAAWADGFIDRLFEVDDAFVKDAGDEETWVDELIDPIMTTPVLGDALQLTGKGLTTAWPAIVGGTGMAALLGGYHGMEWLTGDAERRRMQQLEDIEDEPPLVRFRNV